jgi:selenocysteine-specific elongation factor
MIVTLAGHVDHGKTSLVKALTGVDTDRLAEEKQRGLTIDLGFAYTDINGHRIGFVDVPGHHRFIHNMVAGVASNQAALLVIAADDGPMPQTREHLAILELIGVSNGIVALTKIDAATAEQIDSAKHRIASLLAGTPLANAPVIPTSVVSGEGIDEIRGLLAAIPETTPATGGCFRLAIDRSFLLRGAGLVVTGTVHSGTVAVGDQMTVAPSGETVRIRSLRVQDTDADTASVGDRCAVNLSGVERSSVPRGAWLVAPDTFAPVRSAVIRLKVLNDFPRSIRHWLRVHAYHATSHSEAHVALLDSAPVAPGEEALVEVVFDQPLHPKIGDRLIVRDHGRAQTIGGGPVISTQAAARGRRRTDRLRRLNAEAQPTAAAALAALMALPDDGVDVDDFRLRWNLSRADCQALLEAAAAKLTELDTRTVAIAQTRWDELSAQLLEKIVGYHKAAPHSTGLKLDQLTRMITPRSRLVGPVINELVSQNEVQQTGGHFHVAQHRARLPEAEERLYQRLTAELENAEQPPSVGDLAKRMNQDLKSLKDHVGEWAKLGLVERVSEKRVFLPAQMDTFMSAARRLLAEHPEGFSARQFRDNTGIGRNLVIEILEHFDRRGLTRRVGDLRKPGARFEP